MTRLVSLALVLASIGCGEGGTAIGGRCVSAVDCDGSELSDCQAVDCVDQVCTVRVLTPAEAPPTCFPESDAPGVGEFRVDRNDDDSVALGGELDEATGYPEYLEAQRTELAGVVANTCLKRGPSILPPSPGAPLSGGLLKINVAGSLVGDVPYDAGYVYLFAPAAIPDAFTFELAGEGPVSPATGSVVVPELPVFTGPLGDNGTTTLEQTITFAPTDAGRVRMIFNVLTNTSLDTYDCIADGASGSLRISDELFAILDDSGSFSINFENVTSHAIDTDDGERSLLWTAKAGIGVTWSAKQ